jgi:hypothetical protein
MAIILSERPVDILYKHRVNRRTFKLDTAEVRRELDTVPLSHPAVREWLESALTEGLASLKRPVP